MKMPEDSISPLIVALALMLLFLAFLFQLMWIVLAGILFTLLASYYWLWPEPQEEVS